jgi:hypothetical protein
MTALERQKKLYLLGDMIVRGVPLTPAQASWVGKALKEVAMGASAAHAFSLDEDGRTRSLLKDEIQRKVAIGWLAAAVDDSELGLGLTVKEAIRRASKRFGFSESTLRKYWNTRDTNRSPEFDLP